MSLKSMFQRLAIVFAALLALGSVPAKADPNATLQRIQDSGVLRIPVMIGEAPGYIKDPATGEWSGFYVEWGEELAEILGVTAEPVETTWGNLAADFQAGKIDIAFGLNPNPTRGLVVDYLSVPLFTDAWAIVGQPGIAWTTWADLNNPEVRIVVQRGGTMQVVAEAMTPNAQIIPVEERPLGILEIQAGRADVMILSIFDAIQVRNEIDGEIVLPEPRLLNPATIGIRREDGNEGYANWLTNWVNQQRALGLAQGKLQAAFEAAGIDFSDLPGNFSF